jgi:hypothetical protein
VFLVAQQLHSYYAVLDNLQTESLPMRLVKEPGRRTFWLSVVMVIGMLLGSGVVRAWSGEEPSAFPAASHESTAGHTDPVTPLQLGLSVVLLAAKIGGDLMVRVRQPAVLGELLVGVVPGNLVLLGYDGLKFMRPRRQLARQVPRLVA